MAYLDFTTSIHSKTKRDYIARVTEYPKAEAAKRAKKFDFDYWDGDRKTGYGGFVYDGRWAPVARKLAEHYGLQKGQKVLDIGCGKGFLLHDLMQEVPGLEVFGLDISQYAINHAKTEIKPLLTQGCATNLPYENNTFDLIISINTLHNLYCYELDKALKEIERVGKKNKYIVVESYRNEEEKANLLYWQLTCESFCTPQEWEWWFRQTKYSGDYSLIFFE